MYRSYLLASLLLALLLAGGGCAKKTVLQVEPPATPPVTKAASEPVKVTVKSEPVAPPVIEDIIERVDMGPETVLFEYNSSILTTGALQVLKRNVAWLQANPGGKITIEGHCDERGSDEFNLALGERRALAAKTYVTELGIAAERFVIISYGEEKPVSSGHDELSWSQNRRVEFR